MSTLPCHNEERVVEQVRPTINLLAHMDELHPEVLRQHDIVPADYHGGLVFRSAIESIRGRYIASSTTAREALVYDVLRNLLDRRGIDGFSHTGRSERYDFEIVLAEGLHAAIEVKGGEGNSINIATRPLWARGYAVWCHLDGAIVNQPAHGAMAIVNRISNAFVRQADKMVDVVFFKDILCGTRARPCPKYPGRESRMGLATAPDVFLFPSRRPVYAPDRPDRHDPAPPVHTMASLRLPRLILSLFGVEAADWPAHVWEVHVEVAGWATAGSVG